MANETFYPPVTNLVGLEDLPDELGFVKDGLTSLLDNILYKDLQYAKSPSGDSAFYNLSVVSKKRIDFEVPGTGIFLILNPSHDATVALSEFPVSISYNWPIIAYVGSLDLSNFSFNPSDLFQLALKVFRLSEKTLIEKTIAIFLNNVPNPISTIVTQLNAHYATSIPVPVSADPISELKTSMKNEPEIGEVGIAIFALFIHDNADLSKSKENLNKFFSDLVTPDFETFILDLLKPQFDASLKIGAGLEFPRNVLMPVDNSGTPIPNPEKVMLLFEPAEFFFSTSRGMGYNAPLTVTLNHKAQICETGLSIELTSVKLDISRNTNIEEADQDGRPKEFVGVYIQEAAISLPDFLNQDETNSTAVLAGKNLIIGTGGFSGTVGIEAKASGDPAPFIKAGLGGGFEISLDSFFISFKQNSVISSSIAGTLKIPGFKDTVGNDAEIKIKAEITDGGNYSITLSEEQGIEAFEIPDILRLNISSLSIGEKEDKFFVAISGKIDFIANVPVLGDILPKAIEIKKLLIWEDGSLEVEGGTITLPKAVPLSAGPVKFSVTAIHLGSHKQFSGGQERDYRYFGFDGGISVNPGGVDARGDGIKFYYTSDGLSPFDSFLRIEGIGINLTIPGDATAETAAVILKGYLGMKESSGSTEYRGAVSLTLPKLNVAGSAAMRLNPDVPAFLVDVGIEVSVPILLGSTGLGIYGFRGLIGQKYMPSKTAAEVDEAETWWSYYKSKKPDPPATEGINFGKFQQRDGFSLGAGVSLATAPDAGKTFSAKLFFMLGLPDVFLLQGQAGILKDRIGLNDTVDPPFSALIAISGQSIETAFSVNYLIPDSGGSKGDILTLQATLEMAYFYNNAQGWYINLGKDTPEEKRVQAKILSLFNGYAFLMLSASGIKAGAGVNWEFKKSYGPVKVELGAFLDVGGRISFKPVQIGGFIQIGGYAHASVFGFVLGFDVSAGLTAECPHPFIITGYFKLKFKIKLFWFLSVSFKINVELTWEIDPTVVLDELPVIGTPAANYIPATASNILSREVYALGYRFSTGGSIPAPTSFPGGIPVIPMDSFIDIEFLQAIKPGADNSLDRIGYSRSGIAEYYKISVPPEKGLTDQVHHEFTVESVNVMHWDGGTWKDYFIYEAVSAINSIASMPGVTVQDHTNADLVVTDLKILNNGYWQIQTPNRYDKLRILSQNMFSYQTDGAPGGISIDGQRFGDADILCEPKLNMICVNWQSDEFANTLFNSNTSYSFNGIYISCAVNMSIASAGNPHGFTQGLNFIKDLHIRFAELTPTVKLKLITFSNRVIIHYCRTHWMVSEDGVFILANDIIKTKNLKASDLVNPVEYDDLDSPINKIIIEAGASDGIANTGPLHIAAGTNPINNFMVGDIDEVKLFNKELTQDEISKLQTGNQVLSSLVSSWGLDQSAVELTGNHSGEIVQPVNWIPGVFGFAAKFDNKGYIMVPHDPELSFGEKDFSISIWVRQKPQLEKGQHILLEKMHSSNDGVYGYSLSILNGNLVFDLAHIQVERYDTRHHIANNKWRHVVVTVDRVHHRLRFYVDLKMIKEFALKSKPPSKGSTILFELCYTDYLEALEYEDQIGGISVSNEVEEMENGLSKRLQPIWRPNTKFAIQVETKDKVSHGSTLKSNTSAFHTFAFQTSKTLGHFHKNDAGYLELLSEGKEDEYKLSKLQHYIDFEKSYPNPDGKVINAKPIFYEAVELLMFFRHAYIHSMFSDWEAYQGLEKIESSLEVNIIDSEGNLIKQDPQWNFQTQTGDFSEDIIKINKFIENGQNCTSTQIIKPFNLQMLFFMPDLKPEKLYTAVFNSVYKLSSAAKPERNEVHKYVFQTSRYGSFREQVDSYLSGSVAAVFVWEIDTNDTDVNKAMEILNNTLSTSSDLVGQYADPYDRLIQGALKLHALDAPVGTEFNIMKRKDNGKILGVLIRNPEPFNDPKLPEVQKLKTIEAKDASAAALISLPAKEPSRIFISNANMDLTGGAFEFKFTYFLFDGTVFAVKDQHIKTVTIA